MSDRWWEDERLSRKTRRKKKQPPPLTSWEAGFRERARRTKTTEPGLSADAADRRAAARARNAARGAPASGGPGTRELRQAQKPVRSVRELQRRLRKAGFDVKVDGVMGPETREAQQLYEQSLQRTQTAQVSRDVVKSPTETDQRQLLRDYGFLGAQEVQRGREAVNRERARATSQLTGTVRPGPEPGPGLLERVGGFLGSLQGAGSTDARLASTAGAVGAVGSVATRPLQVWATSLLNPQNIPGDVREFATGFSQLLGALASGDASVLPELVTGVVDDFKRRYGPDWERYAKEDPLWGILDLTAAANIGSRAVGIASDIPELGVKGAVRASFTPAAAGRVRTVADTVAGEATFQWARTPVGRGVQRIYDRVSQAMPARVKGVAVPGSAARRVARQQARAFQTARRREIAEMLAPSGHRGGRAQLIHQPQTFLLPASRQQAARTRLYWESQLVNRGDEGLRDLRSALQRELDRIRPEPLPARTPVVEGGFGQVPSERFRPGVLTPEQVTRQEALRETIRELDSAIAYKPNNRYKAALQAMDELTGVVEEAKLRAFSYEGWYPGVRDPGPTYVRAVERGASPQEAARAAAAGPRQVTLDEARALNQEKFTRRRSLLHEWVYGRPPDEPAGAYVPHTATEPPSVAVGGGTRPGAAVVSDVDPGRNLNLSRRNELETLRSGFILTDPDLLVLNAQKTAGLEMMTYVRQRLWERGQELPAGSTVQPGQVLVKERGLANPARWDATEAKRELVEQALDDYRREFVETVTPENKADLVQRGWLVEDPVTGTLTTAQPGFRLVDEEYARNLFYFLGGRDARRAVGGRLGGFQQAADIVNFLPKLALLYTNPGYYPANLLGNIVFLGLNQGPDALRTLFKAGKLHATRPDLWARIASDMGEGHAAALATTGRGTGRAERFLAGQRRVAAASGVVDRGPRVAAWIKEAERHGYRTVDDWEALLSAREGKRLLVRDAVQQSAREAMVDFDVLSPFEQNYVRRAIFIYPWLRGSAKYAKDLAVNYPERAALAGAAANSAAAEAEERWGPGGEPDLPSWLRGVWPVERDGDIARVVNARSLSPFGTVEDITRFGTGLVRPWEPAPKYAAPFELVTPWFQSLVNLWEAENRYGQNVGLLGAFQDAAADFVPGLGLANDLRGDVSSVYADESPFETFVRRAGRVTPFEIDLGEAAQRAVSEGTATSTPAQRARQAVVKEQRAVFAQYRTATGKQPIKLWRTLYARKADLEAAKRSLPVKQGDPNYKRHSLESEARLFVRWGIWTRTHYVKQAQRIRLASPEELNSLRGVYTSYLDDLVHRPLRELKQLAGYTEPADE